VATQQFYVNWVDATGRFLQTAFLWDTFVGLASGMPSALDGISNAGLSYYSYGPRTFDESTEPATALYPSVTDIANLLYSDSSGNLASIIVPAPRAGIFYPDGITVDSGSLGMVAFNSIALNGALRNAAGGTITSFLGGTRQGRRTS